MSWSEIPMDLLVDILKRVDDVVDVFRCESVCMWWRQASSIVQREHCPHNKKTQIPWLMLSPLGNKKVRYFYSITERKAYEFPFLEIAGHHCVGSSQGYLLSVEPENADLVATNPLARGTRLPLPPTSTLPDVARVIRDSSGRITDYVINKVRADMDYTERYSLELVYSDRYKKAILSPGADTAVAIHGYRAWLAFCHVGDQSWTPLGLPILLDDLDDMIFHKGRLHVINFMGTLAIFDLNHPSDPPFISPRGPLDVECGTPRRYLVESPCGDNLFLVFKSVKLFPKPSRTKNFKIYVLDKITYTWKQIKTLGEVSLFLGFNYSMSISTREFPGIKSNCIYFTDDEKQLSFDKPEHSSDMGVFNLEDASVGPLYGADNLDRLYWPPPMWIMPTLS